MSEEEYSEEEVEFEEEDDMEELPKHVESAKQSRERTDMTDGDENLTDEAKRVLQANKRRNEENDDDQAKLHDYEDRRRLAREREDEELRVLKEKREQRRLQREEEERDQEERRKAEEEERKAKFEADQKKKEQEEKKKRQQMVGVGFGTPTGGRNFILPEKNKDQQSDKFGNIVQAKQVEMGGEKWEFEPTTPEAIQEMGMTKNQREEDKKCFVAQMMKQLGDLTTIGGSDLKAKIKAMHSRISKLETEKYDLEKRLQTQEYDLKELNERQRQFNRGKRSDKDIHPKLALFSKYDRQIDRRNFGERRAIYDKRNAYPCFPNVPPPTSILEFKPLSDDQKSPGAKQEEGEEE